MAQLVDVELGAGARTRHVMGPTATSAATAHKVCGVVKRNVSDRVGSLLVAFYNTECFHVHERYQIKYPGNCYWYWYHNILD